MDKKRMAEEQQQSDGVQPETEPRGLRTLDYLIILLRWKKPIIAFVLVTTLVAAGVSLLLPKWYRSTTSLLPPKNQSLLGGLGGLTSLIKDIAPVGAAGKLGAQAGGTNYLAILNSRRAAEFIIRKYDLMSEYGIEDGSMEKALSEFGENFTVDVGDDGTIKIDIYDKDSVRAAAIANDMVQTLNAIAIEMGTSEARTNREFLEKRVADNRVELRAAEENLKHFQQTRGLVILSDDAKASANAISELYARNVRMDIQLSILRKTTGVDNPGYQQLELEKGELEKKLSTFPELGMESFRLYRDLLIQQKIMEFLVPIYEQARIEEQKDIPVMLVLDKAVPAEKKIRPKRLYVVATAFISSLILSLMFALTVIRLQVFRNDHPDRYLTLMGAIRQKTPA